MSIDITVDMEYHSWTFPTEDIKMATYRMKDPKTGKWGNWQVVSRGH